MVKIKIAYTRDPEIGEMFIDLSANEAVLFSSDGSGYPMKLTGDYDPRKNKIYMEGEIERDYYENLKILLGGNLDNVKNHIRNELSPIESENEREYGRGPKPMKRSLTKRHPLPFKTWKGRPKDIS